MCIAKALFANRKHPCGHACCARCRAAPQRSVHTRRHGSQAGTVPPHSCKAPLHTQAPTHQPVQALTLLEDLGALVPEQQALTPLGRHLAALPLPPRMGKLLLYAIMFACLDPLLTVACFAAFR